jgi:hypothetical protein
MPKRRYASSHWLVGANRVFKDQKEINPLTACSQAVQLFDAPHLNQMQPQSQGF